MIKLQCIKCGYIKKCLQSDLVSGDTCDLCGGLMVLPKKEIPAIVKQDSIENMERQITQMGHSRVWKIIEGFSNVKTRLAYRKIFLEAGGIIPKTEI